MAITLPTQVKGPESISPKKLLLYSLPKTGKTDQLSKLENNLILDFEKGTEGITALKQQINSPAELDEVVVALAQAFMANGKKPIYKYISIDVVDKLEEYAKPRAAKLYGKTNMGKGWYESEYLKGLAEIEDLPKGAGYGWIRKSVMWYIDMFAQAAERLIITAHVKDKYLPKMEGVEEVIVKDISLSGKLGSIVAGDMDGIGYMYRAGKEGEKLMVSFKQVEGGAVMGSRKDHLRGQQFEFDWNKIYID